MCWSLPSNPNEPPPSTTQIIALPLLLLCFFFGFVELFTSNRLSFEPFLLVGFSCASSHLSFVFCRSGDACHTALYSAVCAVPLRSVLWWRCGGSASRSRRCVGACSGAGRSPLCLLLFLLFFVTHSLSPQRPCLYHSRYLCLCCHRHNRRDRGHALHLSPQRSYACSCHHTAARRQSRRRGR
jgi:hypothetical protein